MRDILKVTKEIKNLLQDLRTIRRIESVEESVPYTAPEQIGLRWAQIHEILTEYFFDRDGVYLIKEKEDLGITILSIFSTKTEEELRKLIIRPKNGQK